MKFSGTKDYVATDDLKVAVNAAIVLERPLLVKGEPGTGKTVLAEEVAKALGAPLLTWYIKSTTKAQQGLYEYDAVTRLRDSQLGDERVKDVKNYIKRGKLWDAFDMKQRPVLLIDEIDKADIEFPNDLLLELDRMEFFVYETGETIRAQLRPDRDDHVQQREGTARRVPAPLLLPLHQVSGAGDDGKNRRRTFPGHQAEARVGGAERFLPDSRRAGAEEEAVHVGTARLAEAPAERGHSAGGAPRAGSEKAHSAAARRAPQERAGRASARTSGLPGPSRGTGMSIHHGDTEITEQ